MEGGFGDGWKGGEGGGMEVGFQDERGREKERTSSRFLTICECNECPEEAPHISVPMGGLK